MALREFSRTQLSKNAITFMVTDENGAPLSDWDSRIQFEEIVNFPLAFAGPSITLPINPTDLIRTQGVRTEVLPSVMFDSDYNPNAITQSWGANVPKWTLRGHTGYQMRAVEPLYSAQSLKGLLYSDESSYMDGYLTYLALYRFFESYTKMNILRLQETPPKQTYQMVFINWSDKFQDWWYVEPTKIPDKIRTADKPLYYFYDIELVGVKPFSRTNKVVDDLSTIVSDAALRLQKVALSLGAQYELLDTFDMGTVPSSIREDYVNIHNKVGSIISNNYLFNDLQQGVILGRDILGDINDAINSIKLTVKTVLSPLFTLVNIYKQLKCTLSTLIALPLDLYTSAYDVVGNLIKALKASGCGTTLISNVSLAGYNTLQR